MLRPPILQEPWREGSSHLCARCGELTPGIPIGGLCPACARALRRAATRIARLVAIVTTLPLGLYAALAMPRDSTSRTLAAATVVLWYVFTFVIVRRVAWELKK